MISCHLLCLRPLNVRKVALLNMHKHHKLSQVREELFFTTGDQRLKAEVFSNINR